MPPRRAPLAASQYDEAVPLLAELLIDAAAKRRGVRSGGAIDRASAAVSAASSHSGRRDKRGVRRRDPAQRGTPTKKGERSR